MELFFCKDIDPASENILDENESAHLIHVLRKKSGDIIEVADGKGKLYRATILQAHAKKCSIQVKEMISKIETEVPYHLHIAIAPTKNMDRFEYFVEKAVEIGISTITPLLCEKSERKVINRERVEKIALSAMKQSGSLFLPVVNELIKFKDFLKIYEKESKLICTCAGERELIQNAIIKNGRSIVLIGPEGDFSDTEIQMAIEANSKAISLGSKRMRVETAGVYVSAIMNMLHQ